MSPSWRYLAAIFNPATPRGSRLSCYGFVPLALIVLRLANPRPDNRSAQEDVAAAEPVLLDPMVPDAEVMERRKCSALTLCTQLTFGHGYGAGGE